VACDGSVAWTYRGVIHSAPANGSVSEGGEPRESSLEALGDELNHDIDILRERQTAVRAAECRTQQIRGSAQIQSGFDCDQGEQTHGHPRKLVAGGRYELYSNYALQIQAVAASLVARQ
jgi:hypothetical protein